MNWSNIYFPTVNGVRTSWTNLPLRKNNTPDLRYAINKRYKGVDFKIINGEFVRPSKKKLKVEVKENTASGLSPLAVSALLVILFSLAVFSYATN